jgi:hypothetical protein
LQIDDPCNDPLFPQPADDGQGRRHGHRPTAVSTSDPLDGETNAHSGTSDLAVRTLYLLEYGSDVVARLSVVDAHVARYLDVQLAQLTANLHTLLARGDQALLALLVEHIDEVLVPGKLLLREVRQ